MDLRSLAALRIAMGVLIIADRITRALHLEAHYTDLGVAPADVVLGEHHWLCYLSVHWWLSGSVTWVAVLFAVNGLLGAALALGWRTRLMTALCWYLQASLLMRLPLLHTAGDRELQLLLLWSLLLPMGARWSIDARSNDRSRAADDRFVAVGGFAILMQVCFIYWFAVAAKIFSPMWQEGRAVEYALHLDSYVTPFGMWLAQFGGVLAALSVTTLAWELFGPCLAFIPGFTTPGRLAAVAGFMMMHLGFGLCLSLGIFPWISGAAWIVFLPSGFWDRLTGARAGPPAARAKLTTPRWVNVLAAAALALVFILNVHTVPKVGKAVPRALVRIGHAMRLRQGWGMFTTEAGRTGWFLVAGRLADGRELDLLSGGPLSFEPPEVPASVTYKSARWAQFLYYYRDMENSPYWAPYCRYLCRQWNRRHGAEERLDELTVWFVLRGRTMFGEPVIRPMRLHDDTCSTSTPD